MQLREQLRAELQGYSGESARNWAVFLGVLGGQRESGGVETGDRGLGSEDDFRDGEAGFQFFELDVSRGMYGCGRLTQLGEQAGKHHAVTGGVCARDQLFRIGSGTVCCTRLEAERRVEGSTLQFNSTATVGDGTGPCDVGTSQYSHFDGMLGARKRAQQSGGNMREAEKVFARLNRVSAID